jgi:hypothetical protein
MKWFTILSILFLTITSGYSQKLNVYQSGIVGQENLQAIANISPTSVGGMGFDNRYEGIKGSTRLFDTLVTSYLLVRGQEKYIQFNSDIDVVRNTLIFIHPNSGKLMELSSEIVDELILHRDGRDMIFRTTKGLQFDKEIRDNRFFRVLLEEPHQFIMIPEKKFVEADYKAAYSADRRYDEYQSINKYFIKGSDNVFHQIQLNKKSLIKIFPDRKEMINDAFSGKSDEEDEEKVITILRRSQ